MKKILSIKIEPNISDEGPSLKISQDLEKKVNNKNNEEKINEKNEFENIEKKVKFQGKKYNYKMIMKK